MNTTVLGWLMAFFAFFESHNGAFAAFATIVIALFTIALAVSTKKLWDEAKNARAISDRSAKAAEIAADAAKKSTELSERALTQIERPYIYIFGAHGLAYENDYIAGISAFTTYSVANYGKTPATLDIVLAEISTSSTGEPQPPLAAVEGTDWPFRLPVFGAGEKHDGLKSTTPVGLSLRLGDFNEVTVDLARDEELFLQVIVHYDGPFTTGHETRGTWRFDIGSRRFVKFGRADWNYTR